jgi:hypothetical protein
MIDAVSQLGILMLLLLTGMETDLRLVKQARRAAISTSAAGIVVPFACGFASPPQCCRNPTSGSSPHCFSVQCCRSLGEDRGQNNSPTM